MSVKCLSDGELPTGRKATVLAALILHPASYGKRVEYEREYPFFIPSHMQLVGKGGFFMQEKKGVFRTVKAMTIAAMLVAMSVVIGIFCKNFLNFGGGLFRVTFENLPIILSGILYGPIVGGLVGICSDLVSYLLSSQIYPPNLIVTAGATAVGILSGIMARYVVRKSGMKSEAKRA